MESIAAKHINEFVNDSTRTLATKKYIDIYQDGILAEEKICRYHDYLLTNNHPNPPIDHDNEERDESTKFKQSLNTCHPCSTDMSIKLLESNDDREKAYSDLCTFPERHWCVIFCELFEYFIRTLNLLCEL